MQPIVETSRLDRTGDRDDFLVRVIGPGETQHQFRVALTGTVVAIWAGDPQEAAEGLASAVVYSHGTATSFPAQGYWFDSHNSASTVAETVNEIANRGLGPFLHPTERAGLGSPLFDALNELDRCFVERCGQPFLKSLDVLFERSQAIEDLSSDARDNPHFIFRVCILSGIIDRFNFRHDNGSLTGLKVWLAEKVGEDSARDLTTTFQMVKNLRKQYPIHEHFAVDGEGERRRRSEVSDAEEYFELRDDDAERWHRVREKFREALEALLDTVRRIPIESDGSDGAL